MNVRKYYSARTGKNNNKLPLELMCKLVNETYITYAGRGFFQESMGYWCVDRDFVPGTLGGNIEAQVFRLLRKDNLWPIENHIQDYSEDDLFDIIELLFDHVSKPIPTNHDYHSYSDCGYHYSKFDQETGKTEFRSDINNLLMDYGKGFMLSKEGEILILGDKGFETLMIKVIITDDPKNVDDKVNNAVQKYRKAKSTLNDRKDAIRDLADVLEYLRKRAEKYLESEDERLIFNLANNFGIRHHNQNQKTNYDNAVWYAWMFYYYLATIHALTEIAKREEQIF